MVSVPTPAFCPFLFYSCNFFKLSFNVFNLALCSQAFLHSLWWSNFLPLFANRGFKVYLVLFLGYKEADFGDTGLITPLRILPLEVTLSCDARINAAGFRCTPSTGGTFLAFDLKMLYKLFLFIWCASIGIRDCYWLCSSAVVVRGESALSFRLLSLDETTIFLLATGLTNPWSRSCIWSNLLKLKAVLCIPVLPWFRELGSAFVGDID